LAVLTKLENEGHFDQEEAKTLKEMLDSGLDEYTAHAVQTNLKERCFWTLNLNFTQERIVNEKVDEVLQGDAATTVRSDVKVADTISSLDVLENLENEGHFDQEEAKNLKEMLGSGLNEYVAHAVQTNLKARYFRTFKLNAMQERIVNEKVHGVLQEGGAEITTHTHEL
jgi:hypothetical protein